MLAAIFTGLSGMTAYSRGLDLISNNIANLNTPGFKVSDPLFREIVYDQLRNDSDAQAGTRPGGAGVDVDTSRVSFRQGEMRSTGNSLDVAIDGNGFFMLSKDGHTLYTRAGQFEFDDDGVLIERDSGAKVMLSASGQSGSTYDITPDRSFAPRATSEVKFSGVLARSGTTTTHDIPQFTVIDATGAKTTLRGRLTRDSTDALQWTLEILDDNNDVIGSGTIRFGENGTPAADHTSVDVTVDPESADPFTVKFNFGAAGTHAGVTSIAGTTSSQVSVLKQDGLELGSLTRIDFDERGNLKLSYSNGEEKTAGSLLLAMFEAPDQLQSLGRSLFAAQEKASPRLGSAMSSGLGRVVGGQVELSNVELTEQFTDLIIIQRGYQASSQIGSVANEMMQQLLAMDSRR
jgi:flagellar hook protein FlgE